MHSVTIIKIYGKSSLIKREVIMKKILLITILLLTSSSALAKKAPKCTKVQKRIEKLQEEQEFLQKDLARQIEGKIGNFTVSLNSRRTQILDDMISVQDDLNEQFEALKTCRK